MANFNHILKTDYDKRVKLGKEYVFCYSKKKIKELYPSGAGYSLSGEAHLGTGKALIILGMFVIQLEYKLAVSCLIYKNRALGVNIILIIQMLIKMVGGNIGYQRNIGLAVHAVQLERAELKNDNVVFLDFIYLAKQRMTYIAA